MSYVSPHQSVIQSTKFYKSSNSNLYHNSIDFDMNYSNQSQNINYDYDDENFDMIGNNKKINAYIENHYNDVEMENSNTNNGKNRM